MSFASYVNNFENIKRCQQSLRCFVRLCVTSQLKQILLCLDMLICDVGFASFFWQLH